MLGASTPCGRRPGYSGLRFAAVGRRAADCPFVSLAREVTRFWQPVDRRAPTAAASWGAQQPAHVTRLPLWTQVLTLVIRGAH